MTSQYLQAKTRPGVARKPTSKCFSNSVFKIGARHLTKLPNKQLFPDTVAIQTVEDHEMELGYCWGLLVAIKNEQPMDCECCVFNTNIPP